MAFKIKCAGCSGDVAEPTREVRLTEKQIRRISRMCAESLDYCHESLRMKKTLRAAMKEFDSWPTTQILRKFSPSTHARIRRGVVRDLAGYVK